MLLLECHQALNWPTSKSWPDMGRGQTLLRAPTLSTQTTLLLSWMISLQLACASLFSLDICSSQNTIPTMVQSLVSWTKIWILALCMWDVTLRPETTTRSSTFWRACFLIFIRKYPSSRWRTPRIFSTMILVLTCSHSQSSSGMQSTKRVWGESTFRMEYSLSSVDSLVRRSSLYRMRRISGTVWPAECTLGNRLESMSRSTAIWASLLSHWLTILSLSTKLFWLLGERPRSSSLWSR